MPTTMHADFLDPLWETFKAHLPSRIETHPCGGHRPRIDDRIVFERILMVVVLGLSYRQAGDSICSASTIRRRRDEWIEVDVFRKLLGEVRRGYHKMIGFEFSDLSVDVTHIDRPSGGEATGPSAVNRRKLASKLSTIVDGRGTPLGTVVEAGNRNDKYPFLTTWEKLRPYTSDLPDQITVHLDAGYVSWRIEDLLQESGCDYVISKKGVPLEAGKRWPVEACHSWMRGYKGLRSCNERKLEVVETWVDLVTAIVLTKKILRLGYARYRWDGRPSKWTSGWGKNLDARLKRWLKKNYPNRWPF